MRAVKVRRGVVCVIVGAALVLAGCDSDSGEDSGRTPLPYPEYPRGTYTCLTKRAWPEMGRKAGERVIVSVDPDPADGGVTWSYVHNDNTNGVIGGRPC